MVFLHTVVRVIGDIPYVACKGYISLSPYFLLRVYKKGIVVSKYFYIFFDEKRNNLSSIVTTCTHILFNGQHYMTSVSEKICKGRLLPKKENAI